MADISEILEQVIIDDDKDDRKSLSRNIMKVFPLSKVISKNKASLLDITYWHWKISEHIYILYIKEVGCSGYIDLTKVMIGSDRQLVEITITNGFQRIDEDSEAKLINVILDLHMSMFRLVNDKHFSKDDYTKFNLLRTFGNYFYSAAVSDTTQRMGLDQLIKYSHHMYKVVCLGMFDEINQFIFEK